MKTVPFHLPNFRREIRNNETISVRHERGLRKHFIGASFLRWHKSSRPLELLATSH